MSELMQELLKLIQLEQLEENTFRGDSRNIVGKRVFGGQVLAQALLAATQTVAEGRLAHSLQAYFIRPGDASASIDYRVERVRDGGSFTTRRVIAIQAGRPIFDLAASFQAPEEGMEHQFATAEAPPPEGLLNDRDATERFLAEEPISENFRKALLRSEPIEIRPVVPTHPLRPEKRPPVKQVWIRATGPLPNDPVMHRALLAYVSDRGLLSAALLPHGVTFLHRDFQGASLDHAMWFHQPFRLDDWLLYHMESPIASGSRGYTRGQIFTRDGRLVASVAQEGLIRRLKKPESAS
jgi:acyl-CoA thioesterase-2